MHVKITHSGPRRYVQLVESFRNDEGKVKQLLVTNAKDLTNQKVISRYKSLADIERGFRVLKSELCIGPVYHRVPDRIRAHASLCLMTLILYRIMRMRLKAAKSPCSPERALENLRGIQHHRIALAAELGRAGLRKISIHPSASVNENKKSSPIEDR